MGDARRGSEHSPLVVETGYGTVRGEYRGRARVFKGIPYAAPPVGALRFRSPQRPGRWLGVRDATRFGPTAPQPRAAVLGGLTRPARMSEDCLYLNVWAPLAVGRARPVMVFLHGGAYLNGAGSVPDYDGANLARHGGVIVVTLNYRLGALGQMDFSSYSGDGEVFESNLGLRDQVAALAWVRREIGAFGGDPDRVTVFGESAGGNAVTTLMATPAARGLFSAAIAESSHPMSAHSSRRKALHAHDLVRMLGIPDEDAAHRLREVPAARLVAAGDELQDAVARRDPGVLVMSPTVDGDYLPDYPMDVFRAHRAHRVPLVIGSNRDEASLFHRFGMPIMPLMPDVVDHMLRQTDPEARDRILPAYEGATLRERLDLATDGTFRVPGIEVAEAHSDVAPTWMYRFDWAPPVMRATGLRASHAAELPFVFGNFDTVLGRLFSVFLSRRTRERIHRRIATHWLTFAHVHDPAAPDAPWPAYDRRRRRTLIFGPRTRVEDDPQSAGRVVWTGVKRHS